MENNLEERQKEIQEMLLELPQESWYPICWVLTHQDYVREMYEMEEITWEQIKEVEEDALAKGDYTMLALMAFARIFKKEEEAQRDNP